MTPTIPRTRTQNFFLIVALGLLNALTPFSIDMYLPAFPQIAQDLGIAVGQMGLTVSTYFIGFAVGQIIYGPFLDRFGRKKPLYVGIGIYLLATLGCAMSTSFNALLIFRFLSALGGCAASTGTMAMVRDFFPAKEAGKLFSMLMLVLSVSPLLAPSVGSFVVAYVGWRWIFGALAIVALLDLLLLIFVIPEGAAPDLSVQLKIKPIFNQFKNILKIPQFTTYTIAGSLSFTGLFVYVAASPAIFMEGFHVSAQVYGMIFAGLAVGMIGGGQVNILLSKYFASKKIFRVALIFQVVVGLIFLIGTVLDIYGIWSTIILLFFILASAGITMPNASALALEPLTTNLGSAASLLGFLQLGIGALTSAGVGLMETKGTLSTAVVISISSSLAILLLIAAALKESQLLAREQK